MDDVLAMGAVAVVRGAALCVVVVVWDFEFRDASFS